MKFTQKKLYEMCWNIMNIQKILKYQNECAFLIFSNVTKSYFLYKVKNKN